MCLVVVVGFGAFACWLGCSVWFVTGIKCWFGDCATIELFAIWIVYTLCFGWLVWWFLEVFGCGLLLGCLLIKCGLVVWVCLICVA